MSFVRPSAGHWPACEFHSMNRVLAIDPGSVRVGLAISDPLGITANPLDVVPIGDAVDRIAEIVTDKEVTEIIMGMPLGLHGEEGDSVDKARQLASEVGAATGIEVIFRDERFTTRVAERSMLDAGLRRRDRRRRVDKVAASVLLRDYLDSR
ncbi:MAG: Holliday junction resolvase RuvX [Acidimicrobiia bacterium]|nr:Holliday junction resolvase RuvX [Acidimicrobiia bacterium]